MDVDKSGGFSELPSCSVAVAVMGPRMVIPITEASTGPIARRYKVEDMAFTPLLVRYPVVDAEVVLPNGISVGGVSPGVFIARDASEIVAVGEVNRLVLDVMDVMDVLGACRTVVNLILIL